MYSMQEDHAVQWKKG